MKIIPISLSRTHGKEYSIVNSKEEQIVRQILNHDGNALRTVYREFYHKIRKMVYTFRNTMLDPDDIFQEGLTRAVMNIREGKFRGESSFYTYLSSICRNICLKELENRKTLSIEKRDFIEEAGAFDFELLNRILQVRNTLDEKCREIIDLRFDLGISPGIDPGLNKAPGFEEIADGLGIATDNARQRFKRCFDKLKELVKKEMDSYN